LEVQRRVIKYQLPVFAAKNNIKLIIIDSIACNFRCENISAAIRAEIIHDIGKSLHLLAEKLKAVVLCTNQVSDAFARTQKITISASRGPQYFKETDTSESKIPALGLVWGNFVHTRLFLSTAPKDSVDRTTSREISVAFSSFLKGGSSLFQITNQGIQDLI
jgi:hypothetical protein